MTAGGVPRRAGALALAAAWAAALGLALDRPGFADYEGRYAAVAREMLLSRDWITPRLDYTLFLNKPPLLYWLTAGTFTLLGLDERARLVSLLAGAATLLATWRLGARLWDERTGRIAAVLLATMLGFALEARQLRPDMVLCACTTGALAAWAAAEAAPSSDRRTAWLAAMWAVLGVGMMAKGFVCPILAGVPIGVATLRRHGLGGVRRLRPGLGLAVLAAVVLPWHVAVSLRHPGFAWDYVVNQHLLFFLDRKFPRDSEGIPLWTFWVGFVVRAFPWFVLVPLAAGAGWRGWRRDASPADAATAFAWAWMAGVLGLFSLAPSRLEHYVVPALPAAALLASRGWPRLADAEAGAAAWRALAAFGVLLALAGAVGFAAGGRLLAGVRLTAEIPDLVRLVPPASTAVAAGGVAVLAAARRRAPRVLATALGATAAALVAVVASALALIEPVTSWRPVAALVRAGAPADADVVFEAPEEYQLVGGLSFYLERRVLMVAPPGFIAPTYLEHSLDAVFLPAGDLERRWNGDAPVVFVSDPQRWRPAPEGLVPGPYRVVGRSGYRWVLRNAP